MKSSILTSRILALAVFGSALSFSTAAFATDATAESLYQEGRRAATQKDWDTACRKFKESHDREPAPGTLLNLGDCEEKRGRLIAAQTHFLSAARLFKAGDERTTYAKQRATGLDRRIPKLTIRLHPSSPVGTAVERDGAPLDAGALNVANAVEPGEHVIVVRAPGRLDMRSNVRLAEGETREVELAAGAPAPSNELAKADANKAAVPGTASNANANAKPVSNATTTSVLAPAEQPSTSSSKISPLKTVGFVSLGVGAAALAVGLYGTAKTIGAKNDADAHCQNGCDDIGARAQDDGKKWDKVATAGWIVGGVGLAAGGALLLFGPKNKTTGSAASSLAIAPAPGGTQVRFVTAF